MENKDLVHSLEYPTSQAAWEGINESFLKHDPSLFSNLSTYNSGVSISYNIFIKIRKAWIDPDFDYGTMFNYREQKWTTLVNNYLDLNKLDLVRSKVRFLLTKYNQNYNIAYSFENKHDNGKGCLLSVVFSRRVKEDIPNVTLFLRSSEITKRLIFDLLLVQRMGEYVYGENASFYLNIFANQMYCNTETVLMYNSYKPALKIAKGTKDKEWYKTLKTTYNKFMNEPLSFSKYKVFLRSAKCINPEAFKHIPKPLLAKDLKIVDGNFEIEFPENCINQTQRRNFLKQLIKKGEKK